ncbi:hypothetical protein RQP46_010902 [Phenoliferia psychrophenolica]
MLTAQSLTESATASLVLPVMSDERAGSPSSLPPTPSDIPASFLRNHGTSFFSKTSTSTCSSSYAGTDGEDSDNGSAISGGGGGRGHHFVTHSRSSVDSPADFLPSLRSKTSSSSLGVPVTRRHKPRCHSPSDLANWAPDDQQPEISQDSIQQLPDFLKAGPDAPTSNNISVVQREMEYSISQLLSEKVFEDLMNDPLGRHRFREYLTMTHGEVQSFDLWTDLRAFKGQTDRLMSISVALQDTLHLTPATETGPLSADVKDTVMSGLREEMHARESLGRPQKALLSSLFAGEFQSFVKHKLIEHALVRLGQVGLTPEERLGLGSAFCLTNPRLRDHPIVLVSTGFERLTGSSTFAHSSCRMLAGPATSKQTSTRIHEALTKEEAITTLVLNYRRNGEPFWNLLCILPLTGSDGERVPSKQEKRMAKLAVDGQMIGNAESLRAQTPGPVEMQLAHFTDVYSKVIIFRRKTREVIFVTRDFLKYCDLPHESPSDVYRSSILHTDILDSITAIDAGADFKTLRAAIKEAIAMAKPLSLAVRILSQKRRAGSSDTKAGVLHLTPIFDAQGQAEAFVAIFG